MWAKMPQSSDQDFAEWQQGAPAFTEKVSRKLNICLNSIFFFNLRCLMNKLDFLFFSKLPHDHRVLRSHQIRNIKYGQPGNKKVLNAAPSIDAI